MHNSRTALLVEVYTVFMLSIQLYVHPLFWSLQGWGWWEFLVSTVHCLLGIPWLLWKVKSNAYSNALVHQCTVSCTCDCQTTCNKVVMVNSVIYCQKYHHLCNSSCHWLMHLKKGSTSVIGNERLLGHKKIFGWKNIEINSNDANYIVFKTLGMCTLVLLWKD